MSLFNQIFGISAAQAQVAATNAVQQVASGTQDELGKLVSDFFAQIPLWFAAIIIAILGYALALMTRRAIEGRLAQNGIAEEHKEIQIVASRSAYVIVLVIGVTISLSIVGIDLKPIVAAGAFGLGFALQDIIMNFISGMFILTSRHYTIGDVIAVNGITGRIQEIQTRATVIKAFNGTKVIVPNSVLFKNKVISKTSNPTRRLEFIMGCGYDDNLNKVKEVTLETLKTIPGIIPKPAPSVVFYEWEDFEVLFKIRVWIDSKGGKLLRVKNDVIMKLTEAYNEADFEMPYPIQSVELTSLYNPPAQMDMRVTKKHRAYLGGTPGRFHTARSAVAPNSQITMPPASATGIESTQPGEPVHTVVSTQQPEFPIPPSGEQIPTKPAIPTAIAVTPNSPGQSWLQEALDKQTSSSANSNIQTSSTPEPGPAFLNGATPADQLTTTVNEPAVLDVLPAATDAIAVVASPSGPATDSHATPIDGGESPSLPLATPSAPSTGEPPPSQPAPFQGV